VLVPIDLEWCALQGSSQQTLDRLTDTFGIQSGTRAEFLSRLGSKHGAGPAAEIRKDPWIRAVIARTMPWAEVSADAKFVIQQWMLNAGIEAGAATELLRRAPA
jgi:hypothetical protein